MGCRKIGGNKLRKGLRGMLAIKQPRCGKKVVEALGNEGG